jgi:hypothetical protein
VRAEKNFFFFDREGTCIGADVLAEARRVVENASVQMGWPSKRCFLTKHVCRGVDAYWINRTDGALSVRSSHECPLCESSELLFFKGFFRNGGREEEYVASFNPKSRVPSEAFSHDALVQFLVFPSGHRERLTELDAVLISKLTSNGFNVVVNSMGAGASLTHIHFHVFRFGFDNWLSRSDVVRAQGPSLVRVRMPCPQTGRRFPVVRLCSDEPGRNFSAVLEFLQGENFGFTIVGSKGRLAVVPRILNSGINEGKGERVIGGFSVIGCWELERLNTFQVLTREMIVSWLEKSIPVSISTEVVTDAEFLSS